MSWRHALLCIAALGLVAPDARSQSTAVADLSCTKGPFRLTLPKSYRGVRGLGTIRRDRVLKIEDHGTYTTTHRELRFNGLELGAIFLAILIANQVTQEGESTWFEGLQLLAVYVVLGLVFFFV